MYASGLIAIVSLKSPSRSETMTRELPGGTEEKSVSLMKGHGFALQANQ